MKKQNKNKKLTIGDLNNHPFAEKVLGEALAIVRDLKSKPKFGVKIPEYKREFFKDETYVNNCGSSLANFLSCCEQLHFAPLYLLSYCPSKKMKDAGVTRYAHLLFCVENYIVRTRTLYDRMLHLVNYVFFICGTENSINHSSIINNLHVSSSGFAPHLKKLKKLTDEHHGDRCKILHQESFQDRDLRYLGITTLASNNPEFKNTEEIKEDVKFFSSMYAKEKANEFIENNYKLFEAVDNIFNHLLKKYEDNRRIHRKLYGEIESIDKKT